MPSDDVPRQGRNASVMSVTANPEEDAELEPVDSEGDATHLSRPDIEHSSPSVIGQAASLADDAKHTSSYGTVEVEGDDDAVPLYQNEDGPVVRTRAITNEMLQSDISPPGDENASDADLRKTVEMRAIDFEEFDSSPSQASEEAIDAGDSVDIPIEEDEPAPSEPLPKRRRAATMSLSEEDLEELIEPSDMSGLGAKLSSGMFFDSRNRASSNPNASISSQAGVTTPMPAVEDADAIERTDAPPDASIPDQDPEDNELPLSAGLVPSLSALQDSASELDEIPAAVAAIEGKTIESPVDAPVEMADPTDSGEILEDDMIEEVDEPDVAEVEEVQELQEAQSPPAPPPAPKGAPRKPPPSPRPSDNSKTQERPRKSKPWFEDLFDEDYLRTLPFLTPQATQAEALFVAGALDIEPSAQFLDVGCGYGRHAMELAARGYQVVALDLSLPLLLRGADEAQRRGLNINFIHGDMRELSFESQFDGAYCLFSTFGYFDDETNKKTAQGIARALKPGARLVIEILNRDYLIGDLPTRVWWEGDGCVVLEEVEFNYFSSRIESNRSVVFDDGRQLEQEISVRAYSLHEFGKLLHSAGLRVLEISGSMATRGRFFGNHSREIIVIAEKRAPKRTPARGERLSTAIPIDDPKRS